MRLRKKGLFSDLEWICHMVMQDPRTFGRHGGVALTSDLEPAFDVIVGRGVSCSCWDENDG